MSQLTTLDAAIQALATDGIASVTVGNQTVQVKSLQELLEWRKTLLGDESATRPGAGLRFQQITPFYR